MDNLRHDANSVESSKKTVQPANTGLTVRRRVTKRNYLYQIRYFTCSQTKKPPITNDITTGFHFWLVARQTKAFAVSCISLYSFMFGIYWSRFLVQTSCLAAFSDCSISFTCPFLPQCVYICVFPSLSLSSVSLSAVVFCSRILFSPCVFTRVHCLCPRVSPVCN